MTKSRVLDIIDRRISQQYRIMSEYQRGSAYDRACAAKYELYDLRMEIEKIGTKKDAEIATREKTEKN